MNLFPVTLRGVALLAAVLVGTLTAARAQSIGARYYDGSAVNTLATTDTAGAPGFTQANFTNLTTAAATALRNSLGVPTTAAATLSATAQGDRLNFSPIRSGTPAGADERLNNGFVYTEIGGITLSLTNIPYGSYSLVVYSFNVQTSLPIRLTLSGTTPTVLWLRPPPNPIAAGYLDNNAATPFTYTQSTSATQAGAPANSDYVVFTGLSGSSQTLTLAGNSVDGGSTFPAGFQGFQIVNTSVVPEPSCWALLTAGAGLLGVVTLRRWKTDASAV